MEKLNIQSIFNSLDGEVNAFHGAGELCTFIRLKGCNLNCSYCDTKYAQDWEPKKMITIRKILKFPKLLHKVTITGGEPLAQRESLSPLVNELLDRGHRITIETNGSEPPLERPLHLYSREILGLRYVMDYKLPSSGMEEQMNRIAFSLLTKKDIIKFVIMNHTDYYLARELITHRNWEARKVFSPGFHEITDIRWPRMLAEMMLDDWEALQDVQFSLQLHKILWPNAKEER